MRFAEYLLTCFSEEAVEVAHAAHKVIRFTPEDHHPSKQNSNIQELAKEFNELLAVREMLINYGYDIPVVNEIKQAKKARLIEFAYYSKRLGVIEDDIVEGL